jgi:uncharacterized Fe-S center protein
MPSSNVFYSDLRASARQSLLDKIATLVEKAGIGEVLSPRDLVAVKIHFGEKGNTAFIRPVFVRKIIECVQRAEGQAFLTDTNTLYGGTRGNGVSHFKTAVENGFAFSVVRAPIIIADGIRGASISEVSINQDFIKTAFMGKEIIEADALIGLTHFKGHELTGFGGTLKNLGMGCAARKGKLEQHSGLAPKVKRKKCVGCGDCVQHCAQHAIVLSEDKAVIDPNTCVGCAECILICPNEAINIKWSKDVPTFQKKMVEYALAALQSKDGKALFLSFLTNISPACDCYGHSDAPIVNDIGILASTDPVAIDQASVDLVNRQASAEGSCLTQSEAGEDDKFRSLYPRIDWEIQLDYAASKGLGNRAYQLVSI